MPTPTKIGWSYLPILELLVKLLSLSREISVKDIDDQLMTSLTGSPPLEILVRTSGVKRLSDFMLWQVSNFYPFLLVISHNVSTSVVKVLRYTLHPRIGLNSGYGILFPLFSTTSVKPGQKAP